MSSLHRLAVLAGITDKSYIMEDKLIPSYSGVAAFKYNHKYYYAKGIRASVTYKRPGAIQISEVEEPCPPDTVIDFDLEKDPYLLQSQSILGLFRLIDPKLPKYLQDHLAEEILTRCNTSTHDWDECTSAAYKWSLNTLFPGD